MSVRSLVAAAFDAKNKKVADLEKRNLFLESKLNELIDLAKSAPLETNVCMCGDEMDKHGQYSDHAPVDVWDHAFGCFLESLNTK